MFDYILVLLPFFIFLVIMKSRGFCTAVTMLVILLAIAVQEAHLVGPFDRRFGRSLAKRYSYGRPRQAYIYDEQTNPVIKDGHEDSQRFHENYLVSKSHHNGGRTNKNNKHIEEMEVG